MSTTSRSTTSSTSPTPRSSTSGIAYIELPLEELPLDQPVRVEYGEVGLVVVRTASGVNVMDDRCPHAGYRLSDGEMVDGELECPGHGWRFDVATGGCSTVPAYCVRRRPVVVVNGVARIPCLEEEPGAAAGRKVTHAGAAL